MKYRNIYNIIAFLTVFLIVLGYVVSHTVKVSYAQAKEATFRFQQQSVQIAPGQTGTITVQIQNSDGISAFNLILEAENATIESVNETFSINGHRSDAVNGQKATGGDYAIAINNISSDKKTAKVVATTQVDTRNMATDLTFTATVKRTGNEEGQITFATGQGEQVTGDGQTKYTINMSNPVTLTDGGGNNQNGEGNLVFSPTAISTNTTALNNLNMTIKESTGIAAFTLVVNSQNATIEEIVGVTNVSGGSARTDNYSKTATSIRNNKQTARLTYTVNGISNNADLATEVTLQIKVKKSSITNGTITFDLGETKLAGPDGASYDPVAANQVTLTSGGGGTVNPTGGGGGSTDCNPYWAIGDANCSGQKPDDKDFDLWKNAFIPQSGGPASLATCMQAGNIKVDFNNDNLVDLVDFEIWRRGKYGTVSNPQKQWPAECM